jgi:rhodanese-related sulfurtransferase
LGKVVVYGSGLGKESVAEAVALLNQKAGIQAEALEGGYAAWLEAQGATTQAKGTHQPTWDIISYADLKKAGDAVIIDLRKPRRLSRQGIDSVTTEAPLTDLSKEFPQATISRSPFEMPKLRQSANQTGEVRPLIVLVDDGDGSGTAENQAKILRSNGIRRVVVLAGGESIIVRQGKSGLQRQGVALGNESQK